MDAPTQPPVRIFVSSPGDVAEERLIVRRVIERLSNEFAPVAELEPVFWEHEPLLASASFQDQIRRPSETDIVICILWARLGTRLPPGFRRADGSNYSSGTEFEFEDALAGFRRQGSPALLVYRRTTPFPLGSTDDPAAAERIAQKAALDDFVRRWFHDQSDGHLRAAFHPYQTTGELEEIVDAHLRKLVKRLRPSPSASSEAVQRWQKGSPFRGLESFSAAHADIFFGRTDAVSSCLSALRRRRQAGHGFLLIVGASGSGKSSLVQAGLLPMLTQPGLIDGAAEWGLTVFSPSQAKGELAGQIMAAAASAMAQRHVAIVLDQLEEVFADSDFTDDLRTQLFDAVKAVAANPNVWVVATLRSDYYARAVAYPALAEIKEGAGTYDLLPPTSSEVGQMIRLPAAAAGLSFETDARTGESLDERIRDAAMRSPEALPLLEFTLDELYRRRASNGVLTFYAYEQLGGVEGALAQRAEAIVAELPTDVLESLPRVFRQLTTLSAGASEPFTRRQALVQDFQSDAERRLVASLVDGRLLVSTQDADGVPAVKVVHEALLRFWPRLRRWLEDNQALLLMRERLEAAARRWSEGQRVSELLLGRGKPLDEARDVRAAGFALKPVELALITASEQRARRAAALRFGAIASLAVLSVIAGLAAVIANQQRRKAEVQAVTARETTDFMVRLFQLNDPDESRGDTVTVREVLDRGRKRVLDELRAQPEVRASLMTAMGQAYTGLGLYEPAVSLLGEAQQAASGAGLTDSAVRSRLALGNARYLAGAYAEAEDQFRRAIGDAERSGIEDPSLQSRLYNGLAECLVQRDATEEAAGWYSRAIRLGRSRGDAGSLDLAITLNGWGTLNYYLGEFSNAEAAFTEALQIRVARLGKEHPASIEVVNNLASLDYQAGRYASAIARWEVILPLYRKTYGTEHPEVATLLNNYGRSLLMQGRPRDAEPLVDEALAIDRKRKAGDHDDLVAPLNSLGMIAMSLGRFDEARRYFDEAMRVADLRDHWLRYQVALNLADLAARTGEPDAARTRLKEGVALMQLEYPRGDDPGEAWRWAIVDSIDALIGENPANRLRRAEQAAEALSRRFGAKGLYATDAQGRVRQLRRSDQSRG